jgi:hypothetical protein
LKLLTLLNEKQTGYFAFIFNANVLTVKRIRIATVLLLSFLLNNACERPAETINDPGIPPVVPTGVRVYYASDGEITIEWQSNAETDVTGYNIYRRTDSTESLKIAYSTDNYYFDDSLDYNTTYFYKITSVSIWNRESEFSDEVSATPINRYKPQKPLGLQINARNWEGGISIFITWLNSYESDVTGYNVYRSNSSGFTSDSSNFIAFTNEINFSDTLNINLYTNYYYKVRAVDKGNLISDESSQINDLILEIPEIIFPEDNSTVEAFNEFLIKAVHLPATYRIGLQTNQFFGEIWSTKIETEITDDTLRINFTPSSLQFYKTYYWRVATYSGNSQDPNSISKLFSVTFKN